MVAGLGTLGDLGCHLVAMAHRLVGPAESLIADPQIIHPMRPLADGSGRAAVENEDTASAIVRFVSGAQGTLCSSRSASERKNRLDWEVHGTKAMPSFRQERMDELQMYVNEVRKAEQGFRTILTGPEHQPYGLFCPAPGHQLGFKELKTVEFAGLLKAIAEDCDAWPNFTAALDFEQVIHAIDVSAHECRRTVL